MERGNGKELMSFEMNSPFAQILIAEDDDDFRMMLMRRMKKMGHIVVGAEDGTKAIKALKKDKFDLLIVDLNMPGENGLEVIKIARHTHPNMQVIVVTGEGSMEAAIEALRYRVFDFLAKPLESLRFFEITVSQALHQGSRETIKNRLIGEFQRKAEIDPLTGLFNRHKLNEELEREIQYSKSSVQTFSLIMIILDDLKGINDAHGHSLGDMVLCRVAEIIQSESRNTDVPVRYGGDEFLLVLPGTEVKDATTVAERILESISVLDVYGISISVSMGVTEWDDSYKTNEDFIHAVDQAMYESKENAETWITVK